MINQFEVKFKLQNIKMVYKKALHTIKPSKSKWNNSSNAKFILENT
jgi:sRNA-binding regulator protein Hfq